MKYKFVEHSANKKTGPIGVITAEETSCPTTCPLKGKGCYAENFHLLMKWKSVSNSLQDILHMLMSQPFGKIVRYGDAGDLPGERDKIDLAALKSLASVARQKRMTLYAYTHKPMTKENVAAIQSVRDHFPINRSCEGISLADKCMKEDIAPVVCSVPSSYGNNWKVIRTSSNRRIVQCPAEWNKEISCATCGNGTPLCARMDRDYAIGFTAHGTRLTSVNKVIHEQERANAETKVRRRTRKPK